MKKKYLAFVVIGYIFFYFLQTSKELKVKPLEMNLVEMKVSTEELIKLTQDYLKLKTIRDNETLAVNFFDKKFKEEGLSTKIIKIPNYPNRSILIAEIAGEDQKLPGIILASHADVVEATEKDWSMPAFEGKIQNNRIYGRGALDMKGLTILHFAALINLKRLNVKPRRNLMFMLLPGEEDGGLGAKYILENEKELIKKYSYMINEGAMFSRGVISDKFTLSNIQFAEKGVFWFMAKSESIPGHGSAPAKDYAAKNILNFIRELENTFSAQDISEPTQIMFHQVAKKSELGKSIILKRTHNPIIQSILKPTINESRLLNAMTKNTVSVTGLKTEESLGMNVISKRAEAKIDMRILPNYDLDEIEKIIRNIALKFNVEILVILKNPSTKSSIDNDFFNSLAFASEKFVENGQASPFMSYGATDCFHFRQTHLNCYGYFPITVGSLDVATMHGIDENISIENLEQGANIMSSLVNYWALKLEN